VGWKPGTLGAGVSKSATVVVLSSSEAGAGLRMRRRVRRAGAVGYIRRHEVVWPPIRARWCKQGPRSPSEVAGSMRIMHVMWVIFVDISTTLEGSVVRDDGSLRCLLSKQREDT
jgi:hypothetical protein